MERPDRIQRELVFLAPMKKLVTGPRISQPGVPVPDGGREEFNIGIGSPGAGCGNQVGDPGRSRTTGNDTTKMVVVDVALYLIRRLRSQGIHDLNAVNYCT